LPRLVEPLATPRGDDPEARAGWDAFALYQQGQVAAACERYRDLAAQSRRDEIRRSLSACWARLGRDAYQAGQPVAASQHYRQAVDAAPEREHWMGLGLAHARAGELARGDRGSWSKSSGPSRMPRSWLHEGLAQVVEPRSAPRFVETEVILNRQHFMLDSLESLYRSNAVGAAYQLSHVMCEDLVDRGGMSGIRAFLGRLGRGEPLPQALKDGVGVTVEDLEARLLAAGGRG
jgi:tetratricopeptide (TPR) repeat protein